MMHRHLNTNFKIGTLAFAGVCSAIGCAALFSGSAHAAAAHEFSQPSVEFVIDDTEIKSGATSLMPGNCADNDKTCGTATFKVPIQLKVENASKYNVSIWAETSGLTNGKEGSEAKQINSVSGPTTRDNLSNNWGYRWTFGNTKEDTTNPYIAMPVSQANQLTLPLGNDDKYVNGLLNYAMTGLDAAKTDVEKHADGTPLTSNGKDGRYLTLGFGVNIDGDTPAGTYSNKIHIATTASPLSVTLFNLETMQQMNSDICNATTTPLKTATQTDTDFSHHGDQNYVPEVTLKDSRDGKTYLVRKLADGNCWMSQNLALDFVNDQMTPDYYNGKTKEGDNMITTGDILVADAFKLTSSNTDFVNAPDGFLTNGEWMPSKSATTVFKTQISQGNSSTHPWLDNGSDGMRSFSNDGAYPNENYSVAGAITGTAGTDAANRTFTATSASGEGSGKAYQKYGNLYNWTAATLGTGLDKTANQDAPVSICPKGWQLPVNGDGAAAAKQDGSIKSYINLIRNYNNAYGTEGVASFGEDFATATSQSSGQPGINAYNQLAEFPLNFLRTGLYYRSNGYIGERALRGFWWSSTASSATYAYDLGTNTGKVYAQDSSTRGGGFAVRCVAR